MYISFIFKFFDLPIQIKPARFGLVAVFWCSTWDRRLILYELQKYVFIIYYKFIYFINENYISYYILIIFFKII